MKVKKIILYESIKGHLIGGASMFWINNKEQLERLERRYKNAQVKLIAVSDTRALVKITY